MKLLANENIPIAVIELLKNKDIDIASITKIAPGSKDEDVIERAVKENRILLTFDKDFAELVFRRRHKTKGIILLRISPRSSEYITKMLLKVLQDKTLTLEENFCVVSEERVRLVPLK